MPVDKSILSNTRFDWPAANEAYISQPVIMTCEEARKAQRFCYWSKNMLRFIVLASLVACSFGKYLINNFNCDAVVKFRGKYEDMLSSRSTYRINGKWGSICTRANSGRATWGNVSWEILTKPAHGVDTALHKYQSSYNVHQILCQILTL